jgi:hypothetical protein
LGPCEYEVESIGALILDLQVKYVSEIGLFVLGHY